MDDLMNLFNGKQTFFTAELGLIKLQKRFSLLFGLAIIKVTPKRRNAQNSHTKSQAELFNLSVLLQFANGKTLAIKHIHFNCVIMAVSGSTLTDL